jgi:hypothetical protein
VFEAQVEGSGAQPYRLRVFFDAPFGETQGQGGNRCHIRLACHR